MDGRFVCLLVLLFLCGKLLTSNGQEAQPHPNKGIASHTLCTEDCLCWKELDKTAEHCVTFCEDKDRNDKAFCQALENCRCDPTKEQHLICRKDEWSSEEIRYGCQKKKPGRSILLSLISFPFRVLWYLLSQLVALFNWLLRTIFSVLQFLVSVLWYFPSKLVALYVWFGKTIFSLAQSLVSLLFKLLLWLYWLLKVPVLLAFSTVVFMWCIYVITLACGLIYHYTIKELSIT